MLLKIKQKLSFQILTEDPLFLLIAHGLEQVPHQLLPLQILKGPMTIWRALSPWQWVLVCTVSQISWLMHVELRAILTNRCAQYGPNLQPSYQWPETTTLPPNTILILMIRWLTQDQNMHTSLMMLTRSKLLLPWNRDFKSHYTSILNCLKPTKMESLLSDQLTLITQLMLLLKPIWKAPLC